MSIAPSNKNVLRDNVFDINGREKEIKPRKKSHTFSLSLSLSTLFDHFKLHINL